MASDGQAVPTRDDGMRRAVRAAHGADARVVDDEGAFDPKGRGVQVHLCFGEFDEQLTLSWEPRDCISDQGEVGGMLELRTPDRRLSRSQLATDLHQRAHRT